MRASLTRLKILGNVYEKGKDNIETLKIDTESGIIEIQYEEGSDWDYKIIHIPTTGNVMLKLESSDPLDLSLI